MQEAVSLTFIFQTIGAILLVTVVGIVLVNIKAKKLKDK
jgi:hypothetical protein